jgi:hypothetical protein
MLSHLDPHAAEAYQCRAIHSECFNSRLGYGSEIKNERGIVVPDKVLFPSLMLWVKQGHSMAEQRGDGCLTRGFIAITGRTSQTQIVKDCFATRMAGDNMLDFKDNCYECLGCPTIGAPIHEPRTDATSQADWNIDTHDEYSVPA